MFLFAQPIYLKICYYTTILVKEIEEILKRIGLTAQESRVYLALLELQEAQTGRLCAFTGIASSNIYNILRSLMQKGLASYRVQNNTRVFLPASPDALNELFLEKQRKLDEERREVAELVSNLKKRKIESEPYSNYKYYEGISGVKSMWHEINNFMSPGSTALVYTSRPSAYEKLISFYDAHHKMRREKGIKELMIFPDEDRELGHKRRNKFTEVRFSSIKSDGEWGVVGDLLYIQYITGKAPRAFLIKDETFASTFREVFSKLWERAKP